MSDCKRWTPLRGLAQGLVLLFLAACGKLVDVNVTVVDQKTALENQILGSYEELGDEMLLLASVRSVDEEGKLKSVQAVPPGKMKAIRALQRQEFNRDDIQNFKQAGIAGEGNEGLLVFFEDERTRGDEEFRKFATSLIAEENEDRITLLERAIATSPSFKEGDLPRVQKIFASLNRDNARKGDKIQREDGAWEVKQ